MFGRRKRITNLEKIRRRMTQHEIAVLISDSFCYCPKHRDGVVACSKVSCTECAEKWLQEEAEL